jgi:hypothetical protein
MKASLDLRTKMSGMVGGGDDLDVAEAGAAPLVEIVLDAGIGDLNLVIYEWKLTPCSSEHNHDCEHRHDARCLWKFLWKWGRCVLVGTCMLLRRLVAGARFELATFGL